MHPEVAPRRAALGDFHHAGAVVEPDHQGAAAGQFCRIQARAASGIKHPLAGDVAEQRQASRAVIVGVEEPRLGVVEELVGEHVVLRHTPDRIVHAAHDPGHQVCKSARSCRPGLRRPDVQNSAWPPSSSGTSSSRSINRLLIGL
jgi:hypothetical protein